MIKLSNLITEKKDQKHEYGCVMIFTTQPIKEYYNIAPDDLYIDPEDDSFGIEEESHVTILYGLLPEVDLQQVETILQKFTFTTMKMMGPSLFRNEKYDVLKCDVLDGTLHKVNSRFKSLPHSPSPFEYHPHLTIAYLKAGRGDKYIRKSGHYSWIIPKYGVYSQSDGTQSRINVNID